MDDRAYAAPRWNTDCLQGWQSRPPKPGFTLLPCQRLSIPGSKRKSCICRLDFKSLFLTAWCSCVPQARLIDIGPRGGSALKNLPRDIFALFTSFSAFLLTPGVGNFPQSKKNRQKRGKKGERGTLQRVGSQTAGGHDARKRHKAAYSTRAREGSTALANATGCSRLHLASAVGQQQRRGAALLQARRERSTPCPGAPRGRHPGRERSFPWGS